MNLDRQLVTLEQAKLLSKLPNGYNIDFLFVWDTAQNRILTRESANPIYRNPPHCYQAPFLLDVVQYLLDEHGVVFYVESEKNEEGESEYFYVIEADFWDDEEVGEFEDGLPAYVDYYEAFNIGLTETLKTLLERK